MYDSSGIVSDISAACESAAAASKVSETPLVFEEFLEPHHRASDTADSCSSSNISVNLKMHL
jgi:hypothetical protein